MRAIQFQAIIDQVLKKKDGTLSIRLGTQELRPEETAHIFEFGNQQVWTALAETPHSIDELEIPEITPEFDSDKTPSQRLRNVLYVFWESQGKEGDFNDFYRKKMEGFIEHIKTKLP